MELPKLSRERITAITALNSVDSQGRPNTLVLGLGKDNKMYLWSYTEGGWVLNAMTPEEHDAWVEQVRIEELHRKDQIEQEQKARAEAERTAKIAEKVSKKAPAKKK